MIRGKHWGVYAPGTTMDRYRYCYECGTWRRAWWAKPIIRKGGKP